MSERLELVTDFATLRAGMLIVQKSGPGYSKPPFAMQCTKGHLHRFLLLSPNSLGSNVEPVGTLVYPVAPVPSCMPAECVPVLTARHVAARCVYRVIDDEVTQVTQATARKLERTR